MDTVKMAGGSGFAVVPDRLLFAEAPSGVLVAATRLWRLLSRYADLPLGAVPSRGRLADEARCSVDTIDRAVRLLSSLGLLEVERRFRDEGEGAGQRSNHYTLYQSGGAPDARNASAGTGPLYSGPPSATQRLPGAATQRPDLRSDSERGPEVQNAHAREADSEPEPAPVHPGTAVAEPRVVREAREVVARRSKPRGGLHPNLEQPERRR